MFTSKQILLAGITSLITNTVVAQEADLVQLRQQVEDTERAFALSSGPVNNPEGKLIATFTSIWRMEASGNWRIIFDKGNRACDDSTTF
jgi:hypothetical protein